MRALLFGLGSLLVSFLTSCAGTECNFSSQCERGHYCQNGACLQDCRIDLDCPDALECNPIGQCVEDAVRDGGMGVDAGPLPPGVDGGMGVDAGPIPPGVDAGPIVRVDAGPVGTDAGPVGTDAGPDAGPLTGDGAYLDRCTAGSMCMSGVCIDDVGSSMMCTRDCTRHADCADDHVCASGRCVPDDTGASCNVAAPSTCALGLCLGPAGAPGECVRDCDTARDCPAGYACTVAGGSAGRICVDIEKPCTAAGSECGTGLCVPSIGCTATCRNANDCPLRGADFGLLPYRCEAAFGSADPVCSPPLFGDGMGGDVRGADALGSSCPPTGTNECRSGLCNADSPGGPMCVQTCAPEGGCADGFGCKPEELTGGAITYVCARSGARGMGEPCAAAAECHSALCQAPGYCTRLCHDGLCPTGWSCASFGSARICVRP